ncbi:MAG: NAD(P)-dependent oxidoreductase [Spirochaetota bacterium]
MDTLAPGALEWVRKNMPRTRREVESLPDLSPLRLACSIHLDAKMLPFLFGIAERGADLFVTTCNPRTVREPVVSSLRDRGIRVVATKGMSTEDLENALRGAMEWGPTHFCEMGADLSGAWKALEESGSGAPRIFAGLEATGTGINRLGNMDLPYPVFNWDDLPVKEGLHNRFMVGLSTWAAFFNRTGLSLHEKRVVVLGFGSVGRGVADAARAFGGAVTVVEPDPARQTEAAYRGWSVAPLGEALRRGDVVVTATGRPKVLSARELEELPDGAILLNVGHADDEIDRRGMSPVDEPIPYLSRYRLGTKELFLFADGAMANLTAGEGDSINAFDVTLAVLTRAVGFLTRFPEAEVDYPPGLHALPEEIWRPALKM